MSEETDTYLKHLRAQLNELRLTRLNLTRMQEEIGEAENTYEVQRQEKIENETQLEEGAKVQQRILEGLRQEIAQLQTSQREKQMVLEGLNQQLQHGDAELHGLAAEAEALTHRIEASEKLSANYEMQVAEVREKRSQVGVEAATLLAEVAQVKEKARDIAEKNSALKLFVIQREKEILLLEKKKETVAQALDAKKQAVKSLQVKVQRQGQELVHRREELEAKTKQIRELKIGAVELNSGIRDLGEKLVGEHRQAEGLESKIGQLNDQIAHNNSKKLALEELVSERGEALAELTREGEAVQEKRAEVQKRVQVLRDCVDRYSKVGARAKIHLKSVEYLRKSEVLEEMQTSFEKLTSYTMG